MDIPGLEYCDDSIPGYTRLRSGRGFTYRDTHGHTIRDPATLARVRSLAIPPAWTDVWICPRTNGHMQATGRDAKGRKQYRYHADWAAARNESKFDSLVDFGRALPVLRSQVATDMRRRRLSRARVVATTVWLLDHTLIRIGNAEYSKDSYGLTTLLDRHVSVEASALRFRFVGKSGNVHDVELHDRRVASTIAQCQDLPGQHLLQYLDGDEVCGIGSRDVNDYIRDVTTSEFTAKTFRTWGASAYALKTLVAMGPPDDQRTAAANVRQAIKDTASRLRNTPTVCRGSYVHPLVLDAYTEGRLHDDCRRCGSRKFLSDEERHLLATLDRPG